jgi:hypothetical protein
MKWILQFYPLFVIERKVNLNIGDLLQKPFLLTHWVPGAVTPGIKRPWR